MRGHVKGLFAIAVLCSFFLIGSSALAASPTFTVDSSPTASYATAQVSGAIDPADNEVFYFFQYSQDPDAEGWSSGPQAYSRTLASGSGSTAVSEELTGLKAGVEYKLRLAASSTDYSTEWASEAPIATFETDPVLAPTVSLAPVTTFTGTSAHFSGTIDPNAPEPAPTSADVEAGFKVNWHFQCTPDCPGLQGGTLAADDSSHGVDAQAAGLEPNTHYEVTLVGANAGGSQSAAPQSFTTAAVVPTATTMPAFVFGGGGKALFGARINPNNSPSSYRFEYGIDSNYGQSVPVSEDGDAGSGGQAAVVTQEVSGLAPAMTYHYRVVAENDVGPVEGEDVTFTTPSPAPPAVTCPNAEFRTGPSANLGECRAYELVSPPDLGGPSARASTSTASPVPWAPVAVDGNAAMWGTEAVLPGVEDPKGKANETYVSRRGPGGWTSTAVSPPGSKMSDSVPVYATPNLDRIIWQIFDSTIDPSDPDPEESPLGSGQKYKDLYREEPDGSFVWLSRGSAEQPAGGEAILFRGASTDAQKVFFFFDRKLEPDGPAFSLYERFGQTTTIVGRDQNGDPFPETAGVALLGVSADGSAVVFGSPSAFFVRSGGVTHLIEERGDGGVAFEAISPDGSKVLFTGFGQLSPDDEDVSPDLYLYDVATEAATRISAPSGSPAGPGPGNRDGCVSSLEGRGVFGCGVGPVASTRDASGIYFVSPERLDGDKGVEGGANLYLSAGDETRYVATLDSGDPNYGGLGVERHVRMTPDDSKLLIESRARLTAYDNAGHVEIYAYDPAGSELSCVSCRPSGAPPVEDASLRDGEWAGAAGPFSAAPMHLANSDQHGRRFFFQSSDAILPQDRNGKVDVYSFDVDTGATSLLSSGQGTGDAAYLGNGLDGRDVFFFSTDKLAPQDQSTGAYKVYDARIGGGFGVAEPPPPCHGEGCQGQAGAPPSFKAAGTGSVVGKGNAKARQAKKDAAKKQKQALTACRKKPPKARKKCESNARRRFAKQATKARGGN